MSISWKETVTGSEWRSSLKGMETNLVHNFPISLEHFLSEWRSSLKGMETKMKPATRAGRLKESEWSSSLKGMETLCLFPSLLLAPAESEWSSSLKGMETLLPVMG